jgi:cyanophycin synthetase
MPMHLRHARALPGPNLHAPVPVLAADLEGPSRAPPDLVARLARLPGDAGRDADPRHAVARLAIALQRAVGSDVLFAAVTPSGVAVEYEEEPLGRAALVEACAAVTAALAGEPVDAEGGPARLRALAHEVRLGPSTAAIVSAARRRGIPVERLNVGSLVRLGQGVWQRRIWTAETDLTGTLAEWIAQDKQVTRQLLADAGVPVPHGRPVTSPADAWAAAEEAGPPVVVKPRFGNQGKAVATNLASREQVEAAYHAAYAYSSSIVVERHVPGDDYRLLVIGGRLVAAALREPAKVVGDGRSSVSELIAAVNRDPRRSDDHATSLSLIKLDATALGVLAEQGLTPESVPAAGATVLIRRNANLSTGGTATDVTDRVHRAVAAVAVEAARVVGLDIAGVDVVCQDVGRPLEEQGGAVVEVNAGPGLRMHLEPSSGPGRPVGEAIVEMLFPPGETGRVPLVAVAGPGAADVAARLAATGRTVGLASVGGTFVAGRHLGDDGARRSAARRVLGHPRVEAAVIEVTAAGVAAEGLPFDRCEVAVLPASAGEPAWRVLREAAGAVASDAAAAVRLLMT